MKYLKVDMSLDMMIRNYCENSKAKINYIIF